MDNSVPTLNLALCMPTRRIKLKAVMQNHDNKSHMKIYEALILKDDGKKHQQSTELSISIISFTQQISVWLTTGPLTLSLKNAHLHLNILQFVCNS